MGPKTLSIWLGFAVMLGGLIYAAEDRFASAAEVNAEFNRQAVVQQELFNENRLARLEGRLEALRSRQRASVFYPDDKDTKAYLMIEIQRAKVYEERLRAQKATIK